MLAYKHNAGSFGTPRTLVSDTETSGAPISLHTAIDTYPHVLPGMGDQAANVMDEAL